MIPPLLITLLTPFESLFRRPSWIKIQISLVGTILLTGRRTVTQALRVTSRSADNRFALYHPRAQPCGLVPSASRPKTVAYVIEIP